MAEDIQHICAEVTDFLKTLDRGITDAFVVVYYEDERVNSDNITNICVDLYE